MADGVLRLLVTQGRPEVNFFSCPSWLWLASSLSKLKEIGCKSGWLVHISLLFISIKSHSAFRARGKSTDVSGRI